VCENGNKKSWRRKGEIDEDSSLESLSLLSYQLMVLQYEYTRTDGGYEGTK